ncbi:MAG: alpha-amylase family protein [Acidimicrobiia bacterium]
MTNEVDVGWSRRAVDKLLSEHLSRDELVRFWARVDLLLPDALDPLEALYGGTGDLGDLVERLLAVVARASVQRGRDLRDLDAVREIDPSWFQHADRIGYVAYADRFGGTLTGVREHLDYLGELNVNYLHLMAVLKPREGANDGGYAVADYGDVDPKLGSWGDLVALSEDLRRRGISLCLDLVCNHTAREHPWAVAARAGSAAHRAMYHVFDDRTLPDAYEQTLPEVFPEMAPGNFTWDDELEGWVWTTFHEYQWDLNYSNPDVLVAMLEVMCNLANAGVDVLRIDAIAFTWKRMGTDCQNQPEAHYIAQVLRALLGIVAPAVVLKAEAIVAPSQLMPYLGAHEHERSECHLAYHNQLMVMLWSSLASGDALLARAALTALPQTPRGTSFVTYVRCHDDIGWAVDDGDAARAGLSGSAHRRFLAAFYRGDHPGSWARGTPFSTNELNGDERTCGSAAALAGITAALDDVDPAALELGVRRVLLLYAVTCAFGGIPLIYMGDEIALGNDPSYLLDPDTAGDSRWTHRPYMDWAAVERRRISGTLEQRMFSGIAHIVRVRRRTPALAAGGSTWIHQLSDPAVLAFERHHPRHGRFYAMANMSASTAVVPTESLTWAGLREPVDVLATGAVRARGSELVLEPYGVAWFLDRADLSVLPRSTGDRA